MQDIAQVRVKSCSIGDDLWWLWSRWESRSRKHRCLFGELEEIGVTNFGWASWEAFKLRVTSWLYCLWCILVLASGYCQEIWYSWGYLLHTVLCCKHHLLPCEEWIAETACCWVWNNRFRDCWHLSPQTCHPFYLISGLTRPPINWLLWISSALLTRLIGSSAIHFMSWKSK